MPSRNASRTVAIASSSETGPKTLPRGDAPNPTELSFKPVFPSDRSSSDCSISVMDWLFRLRVFNAIETI